MRLLLDTHVFLWAAADDPRLSATARALLADPANELLFSPASAWEILIKSAIGKLRVGPDAVAFIRQQTAALRVVVLSIQLAHVLEIDSLPPLHKDPFDRLLVGQARAEGVAILTDDDHIRRYPVQLAW